MAGQETGRSEHVRGGERTQLPNSRAPGSFVPLLSGGERLSRLADMINRVPCGCRTVGKLLRSTNGRKRKLAGYDTVWDARLLYSNSCRGRNGGGGLGDRFLNRGLPYTDIRIMAGGGRCKKCR